MIEPVKVCFFGIYRSSYTRNLTLIRGLKENGVEVVECCTRQAGNGKYFELIKKYLQIRKSHKVIIVAFPGQTIIPLAWVLAKIFHKKIIFDAFVSLHDSIILDRKQYRARSLKAFKFWFLDWLACHLADVILLDSNEHIKYFIKNFNLKPTKFLRILVSCNDAVVYPRTVKKLDDNFIVHFHGTYTPIQGIEYIIQAARILAPEKIIFNLVGKIKEYQPQINQVKDWQLSNVHFIDFLPYEKLADLMTQADICLGRFGKTAKAYRCGAFKITEGLAMKKPVITGNTPSAREYLQDGQSVRFCRMADANDLAQKILELKNNLGLAHNIAQGGYEVYLQFLTPKATTADLALLINKMN